MAIAAIGANLLNDELSAGEIKAIAQRISSTLIASHMGCGIAPKDGIVCSAVFENFQAAPAKVCKANKP
jgi:hypothetical protein